MAQVAIFGLNVVTILFLFAVSMMSPGEQSADWIAYVYLAVCVIYGVTFGLLLKSEKFVNAIMPE